MYDDLRLFQPQERLSSFSRRFRHYNGNRNTQAATSVRNSQAGVADRGRNEPTSTPSEISLTRITDAPDLK